VQTQYLFVYKALLDLAVLRFLCEPKASKRLTDEILALNPK